MKNLLCLLVCLFLLQAGCSGSDSGTTGGTDGTSATPTADITTAPENHQIALLAIAERLGSSNAEPSSSTPAALTLSTHSSPAAVILHCDEPFTVGAIPCLGGGTASLNPTSQGSYCTATDDIGNIELGGFFFTNYGFRLDFSACLEPSIAQATAINATLPARSIGVRGCRRPWSIGGTMNQVWNGQIGTGSRAPGATLTDVTATSRSSTGCTGLTITQTGADGTLVTFPAGLSTTARVRRSAEGVYSYEYSGEICIDNIHYLIPNRDRLNSLRTDLCNASPPTEIR